ncbi:hypothetical protein V1509DRAFT_615626 [Lipomyces kononenkoae]
MAMNEDSSTASPTNKLYAGLHHADSLPRLVAELNILFSQYSIPESAAFFEQDGRTKAQGASSVEIHPNSLLDLYNALFDPDIRLARPVQETLASRVKSVKLLIGSISQDVLKMDLSFIDPLAVASGDEEAVRKLLLVIVTLGKIVKKNQSQADQTHELTKAVDDDKTDESEVSVEPKSDYSEDLDSDQGHVSDSSSGSGNSMAKWKMRATSVINRLRSLYPDRRFESIIGTYTAFKRARSPSSLSSMQQRYHLARTYRVKSSRRLHISAHTNRITKSFPTPTPPWLHHPLSQMRRPYHYLPIASRMYPTKVPVPIRRSSSATLFNRIRPLKSRHQLRGVFANTRQSDPNDEWVTDDDDDIGGRSNTPQARYRGSEVWETSNEFLRIPAYYLESQQLSHTNLSRHSSSHGGLSLTVSTRTPRTDLDMNRPLDLQSATSDSAEHQRANNLGVHLLSRSERYLGGHHQPKLLPLATTVINRNENFVFPKGRSNTRRVTINSITSTSGEDDDEDDGDEDEDEEKTISTSAVARRKSRGPMMRPTQSRRTIDRQEGELRRQFMALNVG